MNHLVRFTAAAVAAVICLFLPRAGAAEPGPSYGTKVSYRKNQPLAFPDFTLTYTGSREVAPPAGLRAWKVHEFTVVTDGKEQKVSWSSGTGDIGPTAFSVGRKKFLLELAISDTLGKLKEGELVLRPGK
jgi:hypothetical protein